MLQRRLFVSKNSRRKSNTSPFNKSSEHSTIYGWKVKKKISHEEIDVWTSLSLPRSSLRFEVAVIPTSFLDNDVDGGLLITNESEISTTTHEQLQTPGLFRVGYMSLEIFIIKWKFLHLGLLHF